MLEESVAPHRRLPRPPPRASDRRRRSTPTSSAIRSHRERRSTTRWVSSPVTAAFDAMTAYVAAHPRGEFGGHRYDVAEFGLDRGRRPRALPGYVERYGVEAEHLAAPTG